MGLTYLSSMDLKSKDIKERMHHMVVLCIISYTIIQNMLKSKPKIHKTLFPLEKNYQKSIGP